MYKKTSRRTYKKKTSRRPKRAVKRTSSLKKVIKQVMSRAVEVKTRQSEVLFDNIIPPFDAANFDANIVPVSFTSTAIGIAQGPGQGERIGNSIKLKSLKLTVVMVPDNYNVTTNPLPTPLQVRCVIFYDKETPTQVPTPAVSNNIFQFGNTSNGFTNDLLDAVLPFNTDKYRICVDKVFKLGYALNNGTGPTAGAQYYSNNDFKMNQTWTTELKSFLPQTIRYNDNDQDSMTHQLYMMLIPCNSNGAGYVATIRPASFQYYASAKYTDA